MPVNVTTIMNGWARARAATRRAARIMIMGIWSPGPPDSHDHGAGWRAPGSVSGRGTTATARNRCRSPSRTHAAAAAGAGLDARAPVAGKGGVQDVDRGAFDLDAAALPRLVPGQRAAGHHGRAAVAGDRPAGVGAGVAGELGPGDGEVHSLGTAARPAAAHPAQSAGAAAEPRADRPDRDGGAMGSGRMAVLPVEDSASVAAAGIAGDRAVGHRD